MLKDSPLLYSSTMLKLQLWAATNPKCEFGISPLFTLWALHDQLKGQLIHSLGMSHTPPRAALWQLPSSTKRATSASSQLTSLFGSVFCFNNFLKVSVRRLPSPPLKLQPTQGLTELHPLVFKVLSSKTLQQEISFHQQEVMDSVTTRDVENETSSIEQ